MANEKQFHRIAAVADVPPQTGKTVLVKSLEIALFNLDGVFYAIHDFCPHRGASLATGFLEGQRVLCPAHLFDFDLQTGACGSMPNLRVCTYEVKVEGDEVFVLV
jgi:NAD(P)H-dependent nitrite reductase small subunit